MVNLLKWCVRIAGLIALALGILFWLGMLIGAVRLHLALGTVVAAALAFLAVYAIAARVRPPLAAISILWAAVTIYVGIMQIRWLPGSDHWIVEAVHLLLGLGAIGMAEALSAALGRRS